MSRSWADFNHMFARYLTLERSLSANSIEAYTADIRKLEQWATAQAPALQPLSISSKQLEQFSAWLAEIGFTALSQARIISGVRSFYRFLLLDAFISTN